MDRRLLAAAALTLWCAGAKAAPITFNLAYTGAGFGNDATAIGSITLDDSVLPTDEIFLFDTPGTTLGVLDFSLTVSGASAGNGTFTLSDLGPNNGSWVWILEGPIDLTRDLFGQLNFGDFNWLCTFGTGDCSNPLAPQGIGQYTIITAGEERMVLMSVAPVPVPGAIWLFASAFVALGLRRRGSTSA